MPGDDPLGRGRCRSRRPRCGPVTQTGDTDSEKARSEDRPFRRAEAVRRLTSAGVALWRGLVSLGLRGLRGQRLRSLRVALLVLDAGLGLGLGELGLERLRGDLLGDVDDQQLRVADELSADAWICVPADRPSTETTTFCGMLVASTSSWTVWDSTVTTVSTAASPSVWIWTSTVTFSPRRTTTRSTCSMSGLIGSRWTSLARARWLLPSTSISRSALALLSAIMVS